MMFAVIKPGGKQYRVAADDKITVMTLVGNPGDAITFSDVLMVVDGDATHLGAPLVAGATVEATIVDHDRGPKVIAFKKRRRKHSKRKRGHRQDLTHVQITGILVGGKRLAAKAAAETARAPEPVPAQ
jgi:large subunit ribosomal protein L21